MAKVCELTGKRPMMGNHVSHANNHTRRRFLPNLISATLTSETLGREISMRISTSALRTIDKKGGLDSFLLSAREEVLSDRARRLRREISKAKQSA